jgi:hypothetical protein
MKRRNFILNSAAASVLPGTVLGHQQENGQHWYEWRTYEFRFRGNGQALVNYLKEAFFPAYTAKGATIHTFAEYGQSDPRKLHVLIGYPTMEAFAACQALNDDPGFLSDTAGYQELPPEQAPYNRFSSYLLKAFKGLPAILPPPESAGLFELRTYEGHSEDAVRRKIKMFNDEEIDLFYRTGLNPVFFGDMIIGPNRPTLVYMLQFRDMEERDKNWQTFLDHPEWKAMLANPAYANTVSNIIRTFLTPYQL